MVVIFEWNSQILVLINYQVLLLLLLVSSFEEEEEEEENESPHNAPNKRINGVFGFPDNM